MEQKEQWINEALNSLNGIKRPEGNPYLHTRIMERLNSAKRQTVPARMIWITTCLLLCISILNVFTIHMLLQKKEKKNELYQLSSELIHTNSFNYN